MSPEAVEQSPAHILAGEHLRVVANGLSDVRPLCADVFVERIEEGDFHSWEFVGQVGKTCLTDVVDGALGRLSNRLLETEPSEEDSRKDGDADKEFHNKTLGALATAAFEAGHTRYGKSLKKSLDKGQARDERVTKARDEIADLNDTFQGLEGVQEISASAVWAGKAKTWINSIGLGVAVSPLAKRRVGRWAAAGLYKLGVRLALKSEKGVMQKIATQKQALDETIQVAGGDL